jgi:group I intron endonuclease
MEWQFDYRYGGAQHSRTKNVIYKIENTISGKIYIGQTRRTIRERWLNYKYDLLKPIQKQRKSGTNIKLKRSVQKHYLETGNVDFLRFSIVEVVDTSVATNEAEIGKLLCEREQFHINEFKLIYGSKVCNVITGGRNYSFTKEDKINISESKKRFYQTEKGEALKEKLRNIQTGHTISEETRKKLSESHKGLLAGDKHPLFGKAGELSPTYGMKHKQESINKMKQNRKGKCSGMDNHNAKIYDLSDRPLVSNTGEIYRQIVCLSAFCKLHALHPTHLRNVISGKNKSHKGWKLQDH